MSHVLSEWLLALEVRRKHVRIHGILTRGCAVALVILLVVGASVEVRRTLVLCCAAMEGVSSDELSHITRRVLVKLLVGAEDENRNVY